MRNTKCTDKYGREANNTNQSKGLLEQFVNANNIKCIVKHFKYFWDIEEVYDILVALFIEHIKNRKTNESSDNKG
jgi:hypothetical protein